MSNKSYINVYTDGSNTVRHNYIEDGIRKQEIINYQPIYGFKVSEEQEWKDIHGNNLKTKRFDDMKDARAWKKNCDAYTSIYGDISPALAFITEHYTGDVKPQKSMMNIYNLDIECYAEEGKGFPKASNINNFINAVTFQNMVTNEFYVFGLKSYTPKKQNIHYYECVDEKQLLTSLVDFFTRQQIDIITGWNCIHFDIPYIIDRITLLHGELGLAETTLLDELNRKNKSEGNAKTKPFKTAKKLSPIGKVTLVEKIVNKRPTKTYEIGGIIIYDYLDLYQKFTFVNLESYKLNFVAQHELGKEKLAYQEEYGNLNNLYNDNFELFVDYNILDVDLVSQLDSKLKFIDIAINYAYMMKCNLDDIFGTVKPWDAFLYNELYHKKILCSPNKVAPSVDYLGGYVKDPDRGMHHWLTVYDIVSSYPNQIISFNLSPDTIIPEYIIDECSELVDIKNRFTGIDKCLDMDVLAEIQPILEKHNVIYTSNGQFFMKGKQGFMAEVVNRVFNSRMDIKKQIKDLKQKKHESPTQLDEINKDIEYLESRSHITKIAINSIYGCMGSNYFRYYDPRIASAVTWQGQVCARGVAQCLAQTVKDIDWKYSDTDSILFSLNKIVEQRFGTKLPDKKTIIEFLLKYQERCIEPVINSFFDRLGKNFNSRCMTIKMEHECLADTSILIEKKKYAMHQLYKEGEWFLDKPKLKIKGIEVVRSSTPQIVRDKLKKAVSMIFETADNDALIKFIQNFKKEFFKMPFEQIASPRSVRFSEYNLNSKALPIAVRAAFVYNKALKSLRLDEKYHEIGDGSKIKFMYIKMPNKFNSNVMGILDKLPPEFNKHIQIDYDTQFQKAFESPLNSIFQCIGFKFDKSCSLDDFI